MKNALCLGFLLTLALASIASAAEPRFVNVNGSTTRARVEKVLKGDLRRQNRLTPADVDGRTITPVAALKARETQGGFTSLQNTHATTYVAAYTTRAGNPKSLLVTVSGRISPATPAGQPPMARFFVARDGKSGQVRARGNVTDLGKFTWSRGKNGDGPAERNLAD